jgi:hypothetical protein
MRILWIALIFYPQPQWSQRQRFIQSFVFHPPTSVYRSHLLRTSTRCDAVNSKRRAGSSGGGFGLPSSAVKKPTAPGGTNVGVGSKALREAANTFDTIRKKYRDDPNKVYWSDVYVRSPLDPPSFTSDGKNVTTGGPDTFWFVGKVAFDPEVAGGSDLYAQTACFLQKRMILEYAKHELRPTNFGLYNRTVSSALELWVGPPGDSEMDVVRNVVTLERVVGSSNRAVAPAVIGYNPEIYIGEERVNGGLRVIRNSTGGRPVKPVFDIELPAAPQE